MFSKGFLFFLFFAIADLVSLAIPHSKMFDKSKLHEERNFVKPVFEYVDIIEKRKLREKEALYGWKKAFEQFVYQNRWNDQLMEDSGLLSEEEDLKEDLKEDLQDGIDEYFEMISDGVLSSWGKYLYQTFLVFVFIQFARIFLIEVRNNYHPRYLIFSLFGVFVCACLFAKAFIIQEIEPYQDNVVDLDDEEICSHEEFKSLERKIAHTNIVDECFFTPEELNQNVWMMKNDESLEKAVCNDLRELCLSEFNQESFLKKIKCSIKKINMFFGFSKYCGVTGINLVKMSSDFQRLLLLESTMTEKKKMYMKIRVLKEMAGQGLDQTDYLQKKIVFTEQKLQKLKKLKSLFFKLFHRLSFLINLALWGESQAQSENVKVTHQRKFFQDYKKTLQEKRKQSGRLRYQEVFDEEIFWIEGLLQSWILKKRETQRKSSVCEEEMSWREECSSEMINLGWEYPLDFEENLCGSSA